MTNPGEIKSDALVVAPENQPKEVEAIIEDALREDNPSEAQRLIKDVVETVASAADKVETNKGEESEMPQEAQNNTQPSNSGLFVAGSDMSMEGVKKAAGLPTTDGRSFIFPRGINDGQTAATEVAEKPTMHEWVDPETAEGLSPEDERKLGDFEQDETMDPYIDPAIAADLDEAEPDKPTETSTDEEKYKDGHPKYVRGYDPNTGKYDPTAPVDAGDAYQGFFDEDEKPDDGKTKGKLDNGWEFEVETPQDNPEKPKDGHPEYVQPGPVDEGEAYQGFEDGKNSEEPQTDPNKPKGEVKPLELFVAREDVKTEALQDARENNAEKQEGAKLKHSRSIIKALVSRIKNGTIFKNNTEVLGAIGLLDLARKKTKNGNISVTDWIKARRENGNTRLGEFDEKAISDREAALVGALAGNMEGLITSKVEAPDEVKDKVKATCLEYVAAAINPDNVSAENQKTLRAAYKEKISEIINSNPNADPLALELYADNASELLGNVLATYQHDRDMEEVEKQLSEMKIYIGEVHTGPNNLADMTMLEKVDRLGKKHNTANVIGKASFIVGTWIATGALSVAAIQGSKMGATMTTSMLLGWLAGPPGALIGIGVGAVAAGLYGRHMGRRREIEKEERMSADVNSKSRISFDRKGQKLLRPFLDKDGNIRSDLKPEEMARVEEIREKHKKLSTAELLKPHQESMEDIIRAQMLYMKPKDGLPPDGWNKNDVRNYELRTDLSIAEMQMMSIRAQALRSLVSFQVEQNKIAAEVAQAIHGRNSVRKALSSTFNEDVFAINLFSATSQDTYPAQFVSMLTLLGYQEAAMRTDEFKNLKIEVVDGYGNKSMVPIQEIMKEEAEGVITDARMNIADRNERLKKYVDRAGEKAGLMGFVIAGSLGFGLRFGGDIIKEIFSHGDAHTDLGSIFNMSGNPTTTIGEQIVSDVPVTKNPDGSFTLETPFGPKDFEVNPATGLMYDADVTALEKMGIHVGQEAIKSHESIGIAEYIKNKLHGFEKPATYLDNGTPNFDHSELRLHETILPDGTHEYWYPASGTATGHGYTIDIASSEPVLRVSSEGHMNAIVGAFKKIGDRFICKVPYGSAAEKALESADVGITLLKGDNMLSIATISHPDASVIGNVFNTNITAKLTQAGEVIARKIGGLLAVGLSGKKTDSGNDGVIDGRQKPDKEPKYKHEYHFGAGYPTNGGDGGSPVAPPAEPTPAGPNPPTGPTSPEGPNPPVGPTGPNPEGPNPEGPNPTGPTPVGPNPPAGPTPTASPIAPGTNPEQKPTGNKTPDNVQPEFVSYKENPYQFLMDSAKTADNFDPKLAENLRRLAQRELDRINGKSASTSTPVAGVPTTNPTTPTTEPPIAPIPGSTTTPPAPSPIPTGDVAGVENPEAYKAAFDEREENARKINEEIADGVNLYEIYKQRAHELRDTDPGLADTFEMRADRKKQELAAKGVKVDDGQKAEEQSAPKDEKLLSELDDTELERQYNDAATGQYKKDAIAAELARRDDLEITEKRAKNNPGNFVYGPLGTIRTNDGYVIKPRRTLNGLKYVVSRRHEKPSSEDETPLILVPREFGTMGDAKAFVLNEQRGVKLGQAKEELFDLSGLSDDQLADRFLRATDEAIEIDKSPAARSEKDYRMNAQMREYSHILRELRKRGLSTDKIRSERQRQEEKAKEEQVDLSKLDNDQLVSRYKQLNEALGSIQAFGVDSEQSKKLREQTRPVLDELRRRGIITSEIA